MADTFVIDQRQNGLWHGFEEAKSATKRRYLVEHRQDGLWECFMEYDVHVVDQPPEKLTDPTVRAMYGPRVKHQRPSLGIFPTEKAAEARCAAVGKLFGDEGVHT